MLLHGSHAVQLLRVGLGEDLRRTMRRWSRDANHFATLAQINAGATSTGGDGVRLIPV